MTKAITERLAILETKVDNLADKMDEHRKETIWQRHMMWAFLVALLGIFVKLVLF